MFAMKVIVNPKAGGGRALKVLRRAKQVLTNTGWALDISITEGPGHAVEMANQAVLKQVPLITVIGGDGTVNEVIQGIAGTQTRLAIIPGGTGNDHARSLTIPLQPEKAAAVIAQGKVIAMDIGQERERLFGCLTAIGFPVDVIDHTNRKGRILGGSFAILSSVWQTLKNLRAYDALIQLDGESMFVKTCGIFVLNTPSVGGGFRFAPHANVTDGLLDVMVVGPVSSWDLLTTLPKAYKGRHIGHPAISLHRAKKVHIETVKPVPKMFDGEIIGMTPIEVNVRPKSLYLVVPQSFPEPGPLLEEELANQKQQIPTALAKVGL